MYLYQVLFKGIHNLACAFTIDYRFEEYLDILSSLFTLYTRASEQLDAFAQLKKSLSENNDRRNTYLHSFWKLHPRQGQGRRIKATKTRGVHPIEGEQVDFILLWALALYIYDNMYQLDKLVKQHTELK